MGYRDDRDALYARNQALTGQLEEAEDRAEAAERNAADAAARAEAAERERDALQNELARHAPQTVPSPPPAGRRAVVAAVAGAALVAGMAVAIVAGSDEQPEEVIARPAKFQPHPAPHSKQPPAREPALTARQQKLLELNHDYQGVTTILRLLAAQHELVRSSGARPWTRFDRPSWSSAREWDRMVAGLARAAAAEPKLPALDEATRAYFAAVDNMTPTLEATIHDYHHNGGKRAGELSPSLAAEFHKVETLAKPVREELRRELAAVARETESGSDLAPLLDRAWLGCEEVGIAMWAPETLSAATDKCERAQQELAAFVRKHGPDRLEYLPNLYDKVVAQAKGSMREPKHSSSIPRHAGSISQLLFYASKQHAQYRAHIQPAEAPAN